jgi:RND superfamily putative drug exporter
LAAVYFNRAQLFEMLGKTEDARQERERAVLLDPTLKERPDLVVPQDAGDLPLLDVWTWRDRLVGEKLISADQGARLIVLQLSNEFMATDNIRVLNRVEQEVREVRESLGERMPAGLELGISGSAAVGGDMLRSAAESIKNTELFTVLLVVLILILIYRSPLLIAVPLISIGLSLFVSTSVVALLTQLDQVPGFHWWELKIFTTTKIFVVVILFGAGTDYCLFLISRYREELEHAPQPGQAIVRALGGVGDALAASALTTILGLATMYFADFGKFRYSGPIIGLCLAITLLVCVTLTPALLCAFGRSIFWPSTLARPGAVMRHSIGHRAVTRVWSLLADWIVERPGLILVTSLVVLMPAALHGFLHFTPLPTLVGESRVSYDFLNSLANDRPSKQGSALLRRHFPVGETGPLVVLAHKDGLSFESQQGTDSLRQMADTLYVPGVRAVRCLADPLGDYRPGQKPGVLSVRARRLRMLRAHARTKDVFVTQVPGLRHSVTRLELILEDDPFSTSAIETLRHIDQRLHELSGDPRSVWHRTRFAYTGTTAGIRDLRVVTQSDNLRIEVLVVLAVLAVLLVILRRPLICLYMIGSVLLSFYVTIGLTEFVFRTAYGSQFDGLDWKVPLFLFMILVAVGQDYNVYLATRVFEEQRRLGPREGLRRAVVQTGGIITSCGLIMSGTFLSMTSGVWLRWFGAHFPELGWLIPSSAGGLRSIAEMGFALALGVLLDTFVVRTILVPAFFSLLCRGPRRATDGPDH